MRAEREKEQKNHDIDALKLQIKRQAEQAAILNREKKRLLENLEMLKKAISQTTGYLYFPRLYDSPQNCREMCITPTNPEPYIWGDYESYIDILTI
jgi:hypothetical protein